MFALKRIDRQTGNEEIIKTIESMSNAWNEMIALNSKECEGFNEKGYGYRKELGMRGVMYYIDGEPGIVYDITNLDYTDYIIDYTKENNIRKDK